MKQRLLHFHMLHTALLVNDIGPDHFEELTLRSLVETLTNIKRLPKPLQGWVMIPFLALKFVVSKEGLLRLFWDRQI